MDCVIIKKLNNSEIAEGGIKTWPIWTKEISTFDWYYDCDEECFILEGEFTVHTSNGDFDIKQGDFVIFKKGLKCVWEIKKPIRKHYKFSD